MKIDLSNPPYAVKLKELGFAYSYTDCEKGVIVYTHASPRLVGSPWIDCWDDMECIIDFEDENCMKPFSFTFKTEKNQRRLRHHARFRVLRPLRRIHAQTIEVQEKRSHHHALVEPSQRRYQSNRTRGHGTTGRRRTTRGRRFIARTMTQTG